MATQGQRIGELLARLSEWQRQSPAAPGVKSTGESNARIAELERQLRTLGAIYHWDGERHVLDGIAAGADQDGVEP